MQIVTPPWTMEALNTPYYPGHLSVRPDTFGGTQPRCRRCDILLGTQLCPNPACRAPDGESTAQELLSLQEHPAVMVTKVIPC